MSTPTQEQIKAAAIALVNRKFMRNGSPPWVNPLGALPEHLREEILGDAEAALIAAFKATESEPSHA